MTFKNGLEFKFDGELRIWISDEVLISINK